MDSITLNRVSLLHPKIRDEVKAIITSLETQQITLRIVQGFRTFKEQDALYAQGRTAPGKIVTNARGGYSYHNYGLALDFALKHKNGSISWSMHEDMDGDGIADWNEVVVAFKNKGYIWGGDWKTAFKDNPHLEKAFGLTVRDCLAMYNANKLDKGYLSI